MIPTGLNSHLFCLGVNHKHTPVDIRERVAFSEVEQTLAERELLEKGFTEAVILSTCNRVEIYACSDETSSLDHGKIQDWLHERFQLAHDEKEKLAFYDLRQDGVARHLFEVVSGLDSMVLGETEIFGQVKKSYAKALENGTTGRTLNKLFQQAFATGKFIRTHTRIQQGATSVGGVAVELAEKIFGELSKCHVMVLGAGETSRLTAKALHSRGAKSLIVSNRSFDKAEELASEMGGRAVKFDDWHLELPEMDIVISSTSAPHHVVHLESVRQAMKKRPDRPLFFIDIAVPRDIDPQVNEVDGVYLYDMDTLEKVAEQGRRERESQIEICRQKIEEQLRKSGLL